RTTFETQSADQMAQIVRGRADILKLLRAGNFTLDGYGALVVDFFQALDDTREIYFTLTDRNFGSEFSGTCGPETVFRMDALNVGREDFDGVNGIGLTVHDEVGEVEVDALIVEGDVAHRAHQRDGSFLARFVAEVLPIAGAVFSDFTHGGNRFFVNGVVRIFRNEADVSLDGGNIAADGEVG